MARCKSGKHEWARAEDAALCCNGWRRILAIGQDLQPEDRRAGTLPGGQVYGFQWAPIAGEASGAGGQHMTAHDSGIATDYKRE